MKKNSLRNIANYIANVPELATEYAELTAELSKNEEKANTNRALYDNAKNVIMRYLDSGLTTVSELWEKVKDELPEGFTKSKMQYAMINYWTDEVVKVENPKGANQYRRA